MFRSVLHLRPREKRRFFIIFLSLLLNLKKKEASPGLRREEISLSSLSFLVFLWTPLHSPLTPLSAFSFLWTSIYQLASLFLFFSSGRLRDSSSPSSLHFSQEGKELPASRLSSLLLFLSSLFLFFIPGGGFLLHNREMELHLSLSLELVFFILSPKLLVFASL